MACLIVSKDFDEVVSDLMILLKLSSSVAMAKLLSSVPTTWRSRRDDVRPDSFTVADTVHREIYGVDVMQRSRYNAAEIHESGELHASHRDSSSPLLGTDAQ